MMTIAKFFVFVIFISVSASCSDIGSTETVAGSDRNSTSDYAAPKIVGKIESDDLTESSGVAASRCQQDVYWTQNDAGDDAYVYAFDLNGNNLGTWRVPNAENDDWEDIAGYKDEKGQCYLYIADIGDNKQKREKHSIYRVPEPVTAPETADTERKNANLTANASVLTFAYPDGNHNAETMMVNPLTGDIYVLTKRIDGPSSVYKFAGNFDTGNIVTAEKVGEVSVPSVPNGLLTGGDISPDAKRVAICDYAQAYELKPKNGAANFDDIWKEKPVAIDVGKLEQNEAIAFTADGSSLIATSEKKHPPVVEIARKK